MGYRIHGLDGVRALAVTAVVWHHAHPGYSALPMSKTGFLGVDVFFILSGFLITHLLIREQAATSTISLRGFYARRTLRIFPLYYAVLAVLSVYFLIAQEAGGRADYFEALPFYASYTSNWWQSEETMAITWSLSAEEQFYLLWPPLLYLMGRKSIYVLILFLALNQAVNFGFLDNPLAAIGLRYEETNMLQTTFTPILLGVLLAFAIDRYQEQIRAATSPPILFAAAATILLITNMSDDLRGLPRLSFHLAATILLAGIALRPLMPLTRALEWRPIAFIGVISYGIYLLHTIGIYVAEKILARFRFDSPEALFLLAFSGTMLIAAASYRYFESPLLALRKRFRYKEASAS